MNEGGLTDVQIIEGLQASLETIQRQIEQAFQIIDALEADNARLREALEPFLYAFEQTVRDIGSEEYMRQSVTANMVCQPYIKMEHFFALRAALTIPTQPEAG